MTRKLTAPDPMINTMEITSKALGVFGEGLACSFLRGEGYKIILKNYVTSLGEIDLIARQGESLVFIEVKTRSSDAMGDPAEAVHFHKRRQIVRVAQSYLNRYGVRDVPCRFDVVSILLMSDRTPHIRLIKNAFGEE